MWIDVCDKVTRLQGGSMFIGLGVNWVVIMETVSVATQGCSAAGGSLDPM